MTDEDLNALKEEISIFMTKSVITLLNDKIQTLEARVAELEDVAGDLLTRFDPWSPHDHDAVKRARAILGDKQ